MFLQMVQEEVSPLHTPVEQKRKNPSSLNILKTCYLAFAISILSALVVNHASCKYMRQYTPYHILSTKSTCKSLCCFTLSTPCTTDIHGYTVYLRKQKLKHMLQNLVIALPIFPRDRDFWYSSEVVTWSLKNDAWKTAFSLAFGIFSLLYHFCRSPADLSCDVSNSTTSDVATWHYASEIRRLQFR